MTLPSDPSAFDVEQLSAYLAKEFPQMGLGKNFTIEAVGPLTSRLRLHYRSDHLRPGGTISGPTIFALAIRRESLRRVARRR